MDVVMSPIIVCEQSRDWFHGQHYREFLVRLEILEDSTFGCVCGTGVGQ